MSYAKLKVQLKALENIPWIAPVAAAERVADIARGLAAVDTGEMRDKIKAVHLSKFSQVVAGAKHSGYVEFGTYKMAAQPFMRPAVDQHTREILAYVKEAMIGEMKIAVAGGWIPAEYRAIPGRPKKKR
jgi:HK97 gp10 family phage protein